MKLSPPNFYRPQWSCGQGYVFTRICDSVHRGVSASVHAGIPPPMRRPPPRGVPQRTPPRSRPPSPREADSSIRSMSDRYASYWNAFLSVTCMPTTNWFPCDHYPGCIGPHCTTLQGPSPCHLVHDSPASDIWWSRFETCSNIHIHTCFLIIDS